MNPIQMPAAPIFKGKAQSNPTDKPTNIYDTKAITIGTLTSVIPRSIAAPTACKPSAYWNNPAIKDYLRITIGTDEEMNKLYEAIKVYMKEN